MAHAKAEQYKQGGDGTVTGSVTELWRRLEVRRRDH